MKTGYWIHYSVFPGEEVETFALWEIHEAGNVHLAAPRFTNMSDVEEFLVKKGAGTERVRARIVQALETRVALVMIPEIAAPGR
ncbi:MAG: hypothetical protein ACRD16_12745 [Thermoanaerobaculia bacterium]